MRYQSTGAVLTASLIGAGSLCSVIASAQDRGIGVLDVEISALQDAKVWGRVGAYPTGRIGIGAITQSHNVGTVNVDWFSAGTIGEAIDNRHPFIGQNMYRLRDGRLEQIGLAWLKHGFFSVNDSCADSPGNFLGVGCFDTYGNFTNANRQELGPRSEVNPLTGYWESTGSHFDTGEVGYPPAFPGDGIRTHDTNGAPHDADDHRLRVADQDLLDSDALTQIFIEAFYVVMDDADIENNYAHRQIRADPPSPAPDWDFVGLSGFDQRPAIDDWGDTVATAAPTTEGKVRIASRVVALDPTHNRYEYNIFNMNLDRQIGSFEVPIGDGVVLSDFGFHAPVEDEEPLYSAAPWAPTVNAGSVVWAPPAPNAGAGEDFPNTIRYGTMYTFWFTADSESADSVVALEQHKPGTESALTAIIAAPCVLAADLNSDGVIDTADLGLLIGEFGTPGTLADINTDGIVDTADLGLLIGSFGEDCLAG